MRSLWRLRQSAESGDLDLLFERWHDLGGKEFELFADDALRRADDGPHVDLLQPRIALLKRLDLLNNHLRRPHEPGAGRDRLFECGEPGRARPLRIGQGRYCPSVRPRTNPSGPNIFMFSSK